MEAGGADEGSPNFTQALMELGKQLLEKSRSGETDGVRTLMTHGAPFTADWLGTSPLHMAAANGHLETCEVLLRAGCSRDARTKVDKTPLHLAAYEGHEGIVDLLLKYGASIEARDMLMMTPLHWAVEKGHLDVIRTLLHWGASLEMVSKFDLSPMDIAIRSGKKEVIDILQDYLVSPVTISNAVASIFPSAGLSSPPSSVKESLPPSPVTVTIGPKNSVTSPKKPIIISKKNTGQQIFVSERSPRRTANSERSMLNALEVLEEAAGNAHVSEDALQFLQSQGINVQESALQDDGSIVTSAMETRQTISLSDAGRLALKGDVLNSSEKIIIVNASEDDERLNLQRQLEEMKKEAERYKRALQEKEREAEEYKKRLKLTTGSASASDDF